MGNARRWTVTALLASGAVAVGAQAAAQSPARHSQPAPRAVAAAAAHGGGSAGLTTPTAGSGARLKGGTVYFAEPPSSPPNYIFPMYSSEFCGNNNIGGFTMLMYEPLYWYGDNYSPTVDYDQSIGRRPQISNHGRTYTIHLRSYRWSDGERVTADDIVFWMNLMKADGATGWCDYASGYFPQNVTSYRALNATTFQLTFNRYYNPSWVLYNELAQITPIPLAWDRASLSQAVPARFAGSLASTLKGANRAYQFLNTQGKATATFATSPLWRVVDGAFRLTSFTSTGKAVFAANPAYSGSPKPSIARLVELPFTSDSAEFLEVKAQGPSGLSVGYLPPQDAPEQTSVVSEGYDVNTAAAYGYNSLLLNFNNPTAGPLFRQLYFRQAMAHLVDQPGWIRAYLHGAAIPDYSSVPTSPASPLVPLKAGTNPYPFSIGAAAQLLRRNGWKVVAGGTSVCVRPGSGPGECGAGVRKGAPLAFTLDYETGVTAVAEEMQDLQAQARHVGLRISLASASSNELIADGGPCTATQATCRKTEATYLGVTITYIPGYYPTGEQELIPGAGTNAANVDIPGLTRLIKQTIVARPSAEKAIMVRYANYVARQQPNIFVPYQVGTYEPGAGTLISRKLGGYTANAFGFVPAQFWYLTK